MSLRSTPSAEKPLANTVSESEANDQSDCSFQHIIKWHQRLVLQEGDFVLYQQLATLQLHDLEMVDRRMRAGFDYFRFQGPMPPFHFRQMRCYGHSGCYGSFRRAPALNSERNLGPVHNRPPVPKFDHAEFY